jgi:spore coat polysaccharide biosynthesis protein SpsF (cytidylyltransferase family)
VSADVVVIVQARMGSSRLPGKVLQDVGGEPMLVQVMRRAARMGYPCVLATSTDQSDQVLAELAHDRGWSLARGSLNDVLERFVNAIPSGKAAVVRVTADCPLFDPEVGRSVIDDGLRHEADYASNTLVRTFPDGLDCEFVSADALRIAGREATDVFEREHVTPFVWRRPQRFRCRNIAHVPDLSGERWTVDTLEDLEFIRTVYRRLPIIDGEPSRAMSDVLAVLENDPSLRAINREP